MTPSEQVRGDAYAEGLSRVRRIEVASLAILAAAFLAAIAAFSMKDALSLAAGGLLVLAVLEMWKWILGMVFRAPEKAGRILNRLFLPGLLLKLPLVVAAVWLLVAKLGVSLFPLIAGSCSFLAAVLIEAFRGDGREREEA